MFQPGHIAILSYTSISSRGSLRDDAPQMPKQPGSMPPRPARQGHIRTLWLATALALLLLVFALVWLMTSQTASAHAVVTTPPVFCSAPGPALPAGEVAPELLREPNRTRMMCSQPHTQQQQVWTLNCWFGLWYRTGPLPIGVLSQAVSTCPVLP